MSADLLELRGLSSGYEGSRVLWDIDLAVAGQDILALIGRNGVGKTTLLKTIVGVQAASGGQILLGGQDMTALPSHRRARAGIGYVPQGRHIFPHLSVAENLDAGLSACGTRTRGRRVPDYIFDLFPKLHEVRDRKGGFLSGGEQQQLAIGRALAGAPRLLLLDEPTEGIQPNVVDQIEQALRHAARELSLTIVVVEQYLEFVWRFANRFAAMRDGRIVKEGKTSESKASDVAAFVSI
ncbi:urea ABC transporter ATP-binding subunit UrtE [Pacificimonas flava]|uniref:Urea ABC transporter ATP-binding subunit UrtE n=2 Tax=Pacificimonas TaxID=1960290 RepID=A0A219B285_9SPHN|nr:MULTISPECIES: urea ABC transporter ATP-binding subunit UrtE [Pacificimonas]MBZ6379609.1 urea ABC transporter ATP-binding subunit UrtE [Pacificimonas aurantium]OWV31919.1 urea ABC transporter ATP-binding subunit UrtE [Pacificimonas flava]